MSKKEECQNCKKEVDKLVPMGLMGTCYQVCQECKDRIRKSARIDELSYGMKVYFETGVDMYPESNLDNDDSGWS